MLRFYNHLSEKKEELNPEQIIKIYGCGPTVYDYSHLGNIATFIFYDQLRRSLNWLYPDKEIEFVVNITDIDDKINAKVQNIAAELSHPVQEKSKLKSIPYLIDIDNPSIEEIRKIMTKFYAQALFEDLRSVGIDLSKYTFIYASDYLTEMQEMIQALWDKQLIYALEDGLYFDIEEYQRQGYCYGLLEKGVLDRTGLSRLESKKTKNPADFAVWKGTTANDLSWDIELNVNGEIKKWTGKPGWHLECSVMSSKSLGTPFDIHLGGIDLRFPHHENELAQCLSKQAKAYLYREHMMIANTKMSKSLKNFTTLRDFRESKPEEKPLIIRQWLNSSHYQSQVHWNENALHSAKENLILLKKYYTTLLYLELLRTRPNQKLYTGKINNFSQQLLSEITQNLSDNLNFPKIIALVLGNLKHQEIAGMDLADFEKILILLGLDTFIQNKQDFIGRFNDEVWEVLEKRSFARQVSDFPLSDELRNKLSDLKIMVIDENSGQLCYDEII